MGNDVAKFKIVIDKGAKPRINAGRVATRQANSNACVKAMRCVLKSYAPSDPNKGCCPGQTGHHIPPASMMEGVVPGYSKGKALCVCLEGMSQHVGSHGENHAALDHIAGKAGVLDAKGQCTVKDYNTVCAKAVAAQSGCDPKCIEDQLNGSFTDEQRKTKVTHYQSDSKQLSPAVRNKIDKVFDSAKKAADAE